MSYETTPQSHARAGHLLRCLTPIRYIFKYFCFTILMKRDRLRSRLNKAYVKYAWTDEQKARFEDFITEKYANYEHPENTIRSYLDTLNRVVFEINKPFSDITINDLMPLLRKWNDNYAKTTVHGWRSKLKAFLRWESGNKHDPRAEKIRVGGYVSPITIHDLLTDKEIKKVREAARETPRDLAMFDFHLLWGPRPSESEKINVGDVKVSDNYIVVNIPQTKTISRPVPIPLAKASIIKDATFLDASLNCFTSLVHYLNIHPGYPDSPNNSLWISDDGTGLSKFGISAVFRRLGKKANIKKTLNTYMLRRTAFNRFKGVDREKLCAGFGWTPGSRMPTRVYNKLRPQDYLETLIDDRTGQERDILICPGCGRENPSDLVFCTWCSTALAELPASATFKQFHADMNAQTELETLKTQMKEINIVLTALRKVDSFQEMLKKAAEMDL